MLHIDLPILTATVLNKIAININADILQDSTEIHLLAHIDETNVNADSEGF
jgi:hypothetical protein